MSNAPEHDDVDFEPEDEMGTIGAAKAKMRKLRDELEKVKGERQEYLDGWQRCKADAVNARKEADLRAQKTAHALKEALVHDLIPALDSFDMAAQSPAWADVPAGFRSGMEQVRSQLLDALKRSGIERYGAIGDAFDHTIHDAIEEHDSGEGKSGTILRVIRSGYRSADAILRPAQVFVKK